MTEVQLAGWRDGARCAGLETEMFYPEPATGAAKRSAKAVCARCDVRLACLLDALATKEQFGIRGGLTARERRTMTRRLREQHGVAPRSRPAPVGRTASGADSDGSDASDVDDVAEAAPRLTSVGPSSRA